MKIETIIQFCEANNIAQQGKSLYSFYFGEMQKVQSRTWKNNEYVPVEYEVPEYEARVDHDGNVVEHNFHNHPNWKE